MSLLPLFLIGGLLSLVYQFPLHFFPNLYPGTVTDVRTNITYKGISANGVDNFLNIPFAQDTSGAGRFAPPKPFIPARNTIFNATIPGAACPQQKVPVPGITGLQSNVTNVSEDCLTLRIARSTKTSKRKLPVMVFIYGGGYSIGQIYDSLFTPDALILNAAASGNPVIYVAMNYRLGIFGFASSDILHSQKSLNVALRDQRLALEWVKENIEVFGGDPDRVTIFGESAGGTSVAFQLLAFGGAQPPPFHGAISESGAVSLDVGSSHDIGFNAQPFLNVITAAGCSYSDPSSFMSLECLRSLPYEKLLEIELAVSTKESRTIDGFEAFGPVPDGDFLPSQPSHLLKTGQFSKVPLMIGWNLDDGTLFTPTTVQTELDVSAELKTFFPGLSKQTIKEILALYPISEFEPMTQANLTAQWTRTARIIRDMTFTCPSLFLAAHLDTLPSISTPERIYHPSSPQSPLKNTNHEDEVNTYIYELAQSPIQAFLSAQGLTFLGISHVADIPYVFGEVTRFSNSTNDQILSKEIGASWARFATEGVPSKKGKVGIQGWQTAWAGKGRSLEEARVMVIGGEEQGLTGLADKAKELGRERLVERCGVLMSERIIKEVGT